MPSVSRRYAGQVGRFERPSQQNDDELRSPVVLMVSGGADSTALLVLAATSTLDIEDGRGPARIARERLHVLHINHLLRGIDAEEDEEFVRELARRYGIPCTARRVDVARLAERSGDNNVENAGAHGALMRRRRSLPTSCRRSSARPALVSSDPHGTYGQRPRRDLLHECHPRVRHVGADIHPTSAQSHRAPPARSYP